MVMQKISYISYIYAALSLCKLLFDPFSIRIYQVLFSIKIFLCNFFVDGDLIAIEAEYHVVYLNFIEKQQLMKEEQTGIQRRRS